MRVPARERDLFAMTGSLDAEAAPAVSRAHRRLFSAVREILRQSAEKPVARLTLLMSAELMLARSSGQADGTPCPPAVREAWRLREPKRTITASARDSSPCAHPPGQPCLLHHLSLAKYIQEWGRWRAARGRSASAGWFARGLDLSRSQAHALITGAAKLLPEHVPAMARLLELPAPELPYLEGLARHATATDAQDQARERLALIAYATQHGVQTLDGASFQVAAHWGSGAILALAELPSFQANAGWIVQKLGGRLTPLEAHTLLCALLETGHLVPQPEGPPRPATVERVLDSPESRLGLIAVHDGQLRLLRGELALGGADLRLQGQLLAIPEEAMPRILRAVADSQEEIPWLEAGERAQAGQSALDRVVLAATYLCPITPDLRDLARRR